MKPYNPIKLTKINHFRNYIIKKKRSRNILHEISPQSYYFNKFTLKIEINKLYK
jgi:hypothetical protein